ncbi:MAG: ABC transporter permease [Methanomassiliicoccaceae archaeon]|nr:ABC transporter permease [Methanomassiliicoccaceae archaeon]
MEFLREVYYVMWGDLKFMRHNALNILISSVMGPLLYLLAFGFGLGRGLEVDGLPYIAFIIPGIAALTSLSASFTAVSTRLNIQRLYYRSLDEVLMCPLGTPSVVLGKSLHGAIRGLVSSSIIFAIGVAMAPEHLHLTPLYAVTITLSCLTFSFMGVTMAFISNTHQSMATFSNLVILPMTFLCGTFFSIDSLPPAFQTALYALPLTHSSVAVRASSLGWDFPWESLAVLACFCAALFALNVYLIRIKRV